MTKTSNRIKVVVVDDSPFMRKILSDILNSDEHLQVIGDAKNGKEAIEVIKTLKPDVITLDVEMPIMNGIDALKIIMEINPIPVVMLSGLTYKGAESTMIALELGAIDFIQKPSSIFMVNADHLKKEIVEKVKNAHKAKVFYDHSITNKVDTTRRSIERQRNTRGNTSIKNIVAIGISTGGPRALQHIIPLIPKDFPGSFLIVQHMPPGFTRSLADRLNSISSVTVKEAEDAELLYPGCVYIAPGSHHLEVKTNDVNKLYIHLSEKQLVSGHRPSADVLFRSLANLKENRKNLIGVIMTGMGSDGTKGLIDLKQKTSAYIIAQKEESCVVYGMPKSAVKAGIVDEIVSLEKIMNVIVNRVGVS
ncbi:two-component system, chemotaxis family, response regulator CheB [Anaerovirgula multivorans]|uniref:Protein-glutamate methylesterase/protein-glutamine glutaminase n=1 Tax=Anaerovirgula multivorans TaxID=312168 RepID=A0A239A155_9FIRM|nr:chemotaxis response regulator protein-glutamate methylesterase [Anaerovirgula multivorans]SNR89416.1 two-component system, chemotaxis family, response regulator CheB [Anaerovirgula multivorans]